MSRRTIERIAAFASNVVRLELVALKAAIGQMRAEYAFKRRACGLVMVAVSTYRYETNRSDELRTRLVQ